MVDMQSDFDRLLFFEHARKNAETTYAKDPLDAEVLTSSFLVRFRFRLVRKQVIRGLINPRLAIPN